MEDFKCLSETELYDTVGGINAGLIVGGVFGIALGAIGCATGACAGPGLCGIAVGGLNIAAGLAD